MPRRRTPPALSPSRLPPEPRRGMRKGLRRADRNCQGSTCPGALSVQTNAATSCPGGRCIIREPYADVCCSKWIDHFRYPVGGAHPYSFLFWQNRCTRRLIAATVATPARRFPAPDPGHPEPQAWAVRIGRLHFDFVVAPVGRFNVQDHARRRAEASPDAFSPAGEPPLPSRHRPAKAAARLRS